MELKTQWPHCHFTHVTIHICKIWGWHSKDSSFLVCYAVLFDNQFQKFQRITVPLSLQQPHQNLSLQVLPSTNSSMTKTNSSLLWCFINIYTYRIITYHTVAKECFNADIIIKCSLIQNNFHFPVQLQKLGGSFWYFMWSRIPPDYCSVWVFIISWNNKYITWDIQL